MMASLQNLGPVFQIILFKCVNMKNNETENYTFSEKKKSRKDFLSGHAFDLIYQILRACHYSILKDTKVSFEHLHSCYFCTSRLETPKPVLPY